MSVLAKAAIALSRDKNINTVQYLSEVHNSLLQEIRKKSIDAEELKALKIQTFLRQIKYIQQNNLIQNGSLNISTSSNFPFSPMWSKISQISLMQELYAANSHIFEYNLLTKFIDDKTGEKANNYQLGYYLEYGLTQILNTLESSVTGIDYQLVKDKNKEQSLISVGSQHVQVPDLIENGDDIMKNEFYKIYEQTQKALKEYKNDNSEYGTFMPSVQGKIDINGYSASLSIGGKITLSPYTRSILNSLKNATFTAKNYTSTYELKFGQTNPFRILATVAPAGSDSVARFYRMVNCFESHDIKHSEAPSLFYRIKAIYELTGIRTQYTNEVFNKIFGGNGAKYLIWNNPSGEIYVIPTQKIINEIIEKTAEESLPKNWKDALYGSITIPQINIAKLAK